ncbi:MAG: hypothetical protein HZC54_19645 [Verrucomicrobia bacterium]|nr:hypothetical protein [Verrucomicrobiota bacterium]
MKIAFFISLLAGAVMTASAQLPGMPWTDATNFVGRLCTIEGTAMQVQQGRDGYCLLFSTDPKANFAVIIYARNVASWPAKIETLYAGKKVRVTGVVRRLAGRPEIVISDPSQISIVGNVPEAPMPSAPPASVSEPPQLPPFTCDVRRFTGARRGMGGDTAYGSAFRQRIYIELTLQNTTTQPVTDIEWQWVAVTMSVGSATDQYLQGTESQVELKPFETKLLRSDEIKVAGMTTYRYGQTSGSKFRGYYVRVLYKGHCVFKEGSSPQMIEDVESYLDKQERQKRSTKK